jgi:hypothetical protein
LLKVKYFDSYYRLSFDTHISKKLCRLIHPYKYDKEGIPSPIDSEVYHVQAEKLYMKFIKHEGPAERMPMLRFRY